VAKTPVSDEELQLRKRARRRLVGAIALVLLVIVLVPMFLEREPRQQKQDIDIRIPPMPGQTQAPPISPAVQAPPAVAPPARPQAGSAQPASPPAAAPPQPQAPAPAPATAPPAQKSPPPEAQLTTPQTAPAAKSDTANPANTHAEESYVIQLGAYSNASNAKQLLQQLKARKFPAYTEPVKTPKGQKTRVRVGPYPSVEAAEKARERLRALKLMPVPDAKVVRMGE
jgi:DedD protein